MRVLRAVFATLSVVPALCVAQSVDAYMSARNEHKVTAPARAASIGGLQGSGVFELKGITKGYAGSLILIEVEKQSFMVAFSESQQWAREFSGPVRALVHASRIGGEYAPLQCRLLAIAYESDVLAALPKPKPVQPQAKPPAAAPSNQASGNTSLTGNIGDPRVNPSTSRAGTRNLRSDAASVKIYADFIKGRNKKLTDEVCYAIADSVIHHSNQFGVDARLMVAIVMVESNFNPNAVSHAGAQGLGQLMPGTANGLGVRDSFNIDDNIRGATKLIRGHLDKYIKQTGDTYQGTVLTLAAYNAGSGAVRKYGGVPPYKETQNYVTRVLTYYRQLMG